MKDQFNIEEQFQEYARRVKLDLDAVSPVQVIETRRAFYGAWGQLLIAFRDHLPDDEDEAVKIMQKSLEDVGAFWRRQASDGRGSDRHHEANLLGSSRSLSGSPLMPRSPTG